MTTLPKSNARNLERIRKNQQRSRDRKRQYTAELEEKVRCLEQSLSEASAGKACAAGKGCKPQRPVSTNADFARLTHENRIRGDLLNVLGIDQATQERFIRGAPKSDSVFGQQSHDESSGDADREPGVEDINGDALADFSPANEVGMNFRTESDTIISQSGGAGPVAITNRRRAQSPSISEILGPSLLNTRLLGPDPSLCSHCSGTSLTSTVPRDPSDSTTACSIAYSMILSNNRRGYRFIDLESRMRSGYQNAGAPGEECRVLNKVLFEVLADIT